MKEVKLFFKFIIFNRILNAIGYPVSPCLLCLSCRKLKLSYHGINQVLCVFCNNIILDKVILKYKFLKWF